MITHGGVLMDRIGAPDDAVRGKLPADIINPVAAYSLNRKLRYLYSGDYFRYRQAGGGEADYPTSTPNLSETVYITKIYDQKSKHGIPVTDAAQTTEANQPTLTHDGTHYKANFTSGQYLGLDALAPSVSADLFISVVGEGDFPRPALGLWGTDNISVDIGANARFTVNEDHGAMTSFPNGRGVLSCFSGYHAPSNNNRMMSCYHANDHDGDTVESATSASVSSAAIGRNDDRYFIGEVLEVVLYLGDISKYWGEEMHKNTHTFYTNYI